MHRFTTRQRSVRAWIATLALAAGCGTSEGDGGTNPAPTPTISISLSASALAVQQGGNGTLTATITRGGGFTGTVTIVTEGAPAGVTAAASNVATTGGTTTGTVTVGVGAAVAPGTYQLTVRASGQGVADVTAAFTLTVTAAPSYTLAVAPSPVSVAQGAQGQATVTLTRTSFADPVTLALEGAPAGVTGTFNPATPAGTTSTLTLAVGGAVAPGTYQLTVRGTAQGLADRTATLSLTVTAVVTGNYTLTTTPAAAIGVTQGGAAQATVNINRTGGFAGTVTLSVTGAPAGLTATLAPAATAGAASTLSLSAQGSLAVGAYPLTLRGTATGLADQTVNLTVNVSAPAGGSIVFDYSACDAASRPVWFAVQDGNGPWTRVTPVNDRYGFDLAASTGGLAIVLASGPTAGVTVQYMSRTEIQSWGAAGSLCAATAGKTVNGSVVNLSALQSVLASLGGATTSANAGTPAFQFTNVPAGPQDLVAYRSSFTGPGAGDRLIIRRDLNVADGGSVAPLDFTAGEAFAPQGATLTVTGLGGGENLTHTMFYSTRAECRTGALYSTVPAAGGGPVTAFGVPAAQQRGTDFHSVQATAIAGSTAFRTVLESFAAIGARTVALPTALPVPAVTVLAGPYKRLQFQFTLPADVASSATVGYVDGPGARTVSISATGAGFLGGTAVNLAMPDFSGVAGWNNAWAPAAGAAVNWTATGAGALLTAFCSEGARIATSTRAGTA